MAAISATACSTAQRSGPQPVGLSDLWLVSSARPAQVYATSGAIAAVEGTDRCTATLVDGQTRAVLHASGEGCQVARTAQTTTTHRVRVIGTASVGSSMPDVALHPDAGGCEPFLVFDASRIELAP